ncbi:hypothetical protein [Kordia sp.]|uniref:hypothetical protein n=1 Tax=Kordia sp. TaxID=1965332 RepID=UPI003B58CCA9
MKNYLLLACLTLFFISCSSDDNTTLESEENFYALTVGNTWVYGHQRRIGQSEEFENINVIDSVKIVDTEEINGNTFFKFRTRTSGNESNQAFCSPNGEHFAYFRDSIGYLIDDRGKIHFSPEGDTEEYVLKTFPSHRLIFNLSEESEVVITPAGDFDCYWMNLFIRYDPDSERSIGTSKYYRKEGIGEVFTTTSFTNNPEHTIEKRLISYEVQ